MTIGDIKNVLIVANDEYSEINKKNLDLGISDGVDFCAESIEQSVKSERD